MTPREIDALIATHIMGWKYVDRRAAGWGDGPQIWLTGDEREEGSPTYQGFYPSTDPVASKALREKMRADGWLLSVMDQRKEKDDPLEAMVRVRKWGENRGIVITDADEFRAVALAALAACGVEVKP